MTETRTDADNEDMVDIKGFTALINSRKSRKWGGVGLFLNDNLKLKYKHKHNLVSDTDAVSFKSLSIN